MDNYQEDSSNEEKDIKPFLPTLNRGSMDLSNIVSGPKKWLPTGLQDGNRKSAFLPYKVYSCNTVLTNLQRGNTLAENPLPQSTEVNFHMKAGQGELTEADVLKERDVNVKDANNLTPLHWACFYGQINSVQLLVEHGADINELGPEEETPLILAAAGGHHDIVRFLIAHGADVNHTDHMCNSSLMYAAKGNHPHTCQELLLNGADFSVVNLNDENALTIAVDNNSILAQIVLEKFIILQLESAGNPSQIVDNESSPIEDV
ncbi:unnamed protein product [Phyllotreta striolata]|uniref:Uncharacterized protein n=1 Tax=Phyllotreta striolata TaxID=444603 RepID=A0A9N9TTK5_PHYSR|nr:unnamed protein product [Phyllotreta striolata]